MSTSQALRTHRQKNRQAEATEQVIAFQRRDEWFALPIFAVQRVIPLGDVYVDILPDLKKRGFPSSQTAEAE